jgi:hypothetical protein
MTTLNTNLNVAGIPENIAVLNPLPVGKTQFRDVTLGDINLLYETAMTGTKHKTKIFIARVSGESSTMTVVRYEDTEVSLFKYSWRRSMLLVPI